MDQKIFAIGGPIIWKKFKFHVQVRPQRGEQKYPSKTGRPVTMKNLCLSICPVLCLDSRYCISNSATVLLACPFLQLLSVYVVEICAVLYPLLAIVDWLHISPAYNKKQTVSGSGHNKSNKSNTFVNQTNPKLWKLKVNEHTRSSSCHCQLTLAGALREPARPCQLGSVFGRPQRPGPGLAQAWHLPMPGLSAMVSDAWQTVTLAHGWLGMISWPDGVQPPIFVTAVLKRWQKTCLHLVTCWSARYIIRRYATFVAILCLVNYTNLSRNVGPHSKFEYSNPFLFCCLAWTRSSFSAQQLAQHREISTGR